MMSKNGSVSRFNDFPGARVCDTCGMMSKNGSIFAAVPLGGAEWLCLSVRLVLLFAALPPRGCASIACESTTLKQ